MSLTILYSTIPELIPKSQSQDDFSTCSIQKMSLQEFKSHLNELWSPLDFEAQTVGNIFKRIQLFDSICRIYTQSQEPLSSQAREELNKSALNSVDYRDTINELLANTESNKDEIIELLGKIKCNCIRVMTLAVFDAQTIDNWINFIVQLCSGCDLATTKPKQLESRDNASDKSVKSTKCTQFEALKLMNTILKVCREPLRRDGKLKLNVSPAWILARYRHPILKLCIDITRDISLGLYQYHNSETIHAALECLRDICDLFSIIDKLKIIKKILFQLAVLTARCKRTVNEITIVLPMNKETNPQHLMSISTNQILRDLFTRLCTNDNQLFTSTFEFLESVLTSVEATPEAQSASIDVLSDLIRCNPLSRKDVRVKEEKLIKEALKNVHPTVRASACEYLTTNSRFILSPTHSKLVLQIVIADPEPYVRVEAIRCLGNSTNRRQKTIKSSIENVLDNLLAKLSYEYDDASINQPNATILSQSDLNLKRINILDRVLDVMKLYLNESWAPVSNALPTIKSYIPKIFEYNDKLIINILEISRLVLSIERKCIPKEPLRFQVASTVETRAHPSAEETERIVIEILEGVFCFPLDLIGEQVWLSGLALLRTLTKLRTDSDVSILLKILDSAMQKAAKTNSTGEAFFGRYFPSHVAPSIYECITRPGVINVSLEMCIHIVQNQSMRYSFETRACAAKLFQVALIDFNFGNRESNKDTILMALLKCVIIVLLKEFQITEDPQVSRELACQNGSATKRDQPRRSSLTEDTDRDRFKSQLFQLVLTAIYKERHMALESLSQLDDQFKLDRGFLLNCVVKCILKGGISRDIFCPQHEVRIIIYGLCTLLQMSAYDRPKYLDECGEEALLYILNLFESLHQLFEQHLNDCGRTERTGILERNYLSWTPKSEQTFTTKLDKSEGFCAEIRELHDALDRICKCEFYRYNNMTKSLSMMQLRFLKDLYDYADEKRPEKWATLMRSQSVRLMDKLRQFRKK